jgi:hypothetical protein
MSYSPANIHIPISAQRKPQKRNEQMKKEGTKKRKAEGIGRKGTKK